MPSNHTLISDSYEIFEPVIASEYITSLVSSNPTTMNNDDPDNNVRYMGADPNNYVRFNNELWRIIGVFNMSVKAGGEKQKMLKIVRMGSIGSYSWASSIDASSMLTWSSSLISEFLNNSYYNNLSLEAKNLITSVRWRVADYDTYSSTASNWYIAETSNYWTGYIGLISAADYGYATSGGNTSSRLTCLNTGLESWSTNDSTSDCVYNNYLYDYIDSLIMANNSSVRPTLVYRLYYGGYIQTIGMDIPAATYPVVYLNPETMITGGNGTSSNPYILG